MGLSQTYRCIRTIGQEKSCNRNRREKIINSKRQKFQQTAKTHNFKIKNGINWKCVFCDCTGHRLNDCTEVKDPVKRRKIVDSMKLCFNNLKYGYRAADCPSHTCFKCNRKHNTSLAT